MSAREKRRARRTAAPAHSWQEHGYRMEDAPCEHEMPVNAQNDTGYIRHDADADWRGDPFDDSAVDPSLRELRSEDLNSHSSDFWMAPGERPAESPIERSTAQTKTHRVRRPRKQLSINRKILLTAAASLALLLVVTVAACAVIFRIDEIVISGNATISDSVIRSLSGVHEGQNLITLSSDMVEANLERNRYLKFVSLKKEFPNRVVINVLERTQAAYLNYCGIVYVLDSRGMVLEESSNPNAIPALMRLEGLDVRNCVLGRTVMVNDEERLSIYREATLEMKAMGLYGSIQELYVSDVSNLYLATEDGFSVRLGDGSRIHAKLRAMVLAHEELLAEGKSGGTIDVSVPETPTWIPEGS